MTSRPLSEGNALQRAYARFAAPYYRRLSPEMQVQAELMDRFLYSRRGLGVWLGLLGAITGSSLGLRALDMPWALAVGLSLLVWIGVPLMLLSAWLQPDKFSYAQIRAHLLRALLLAVAGALTGFLVGHMARTGTLDLVRLGQELVDKAAVLIPATLGAGVGMLALSWGAARVRLDMLRRAQTERQVAEARLKLLQAQLQPHFLFNTLAALQHWVDTGDARAPALLRSLTGFLRGSTELLGRERVPLSQELVVVEGYLQIMQARLGERLRYALEADADAQARPVPPGLLLTLVENAIEHGVAPALAGGMVQVQARCEAPTLVIEVRNDGLDLPADWQPGTGLGIVQARLQHHGGALSLMPGPRGTLARLTLPSTAQETA